MSRMLRRLDRIEHEIPVPKTDYEMLIEIQKEFHLPLPLSTPASVKEIGLQMLDRARKIKDETERNLAFDAFKKWSDSIHAKFGAAS